jgi:hypothetical protein
MGLVLIGDPLGSGALAVGLVSASFNAAAGFDTTAGVDAAAVFSPILATAGADGEGEGLVADVNSFSTVGVSGDCGVGLEDEAPGAGTAEVGAAAGVSSLRKLSLYFVFASSVAETAGLPGTEGLSSVALAVSTSSRP